MASKSLFKSLTGKLDPKTNATNEAGGTAYSFTAQHKLAQYAAQGPQLSMVERNVSSILVVIGVFPQLPASGWASALRVRR